MRESFALIGMVRALEASTVGLTNKENNTCKQFTTPSYHKLTLIPILCLPNHSLGPAYILPLLRHPQKGCSSMKQRSVASIRVIRIKQVAAALS